MEEFKTKHINGRPYHPQSQGMEFLLKHNARYFRIKLNDKIYDQYESNSFCISSVWTLSEATVLLM